MVRKRHVRHFAWIDGKRNVVMSDNIVLADHRSLEQMFTENDMSRKASDRDPVSFNPYPKSPNLP